MKLRIAAGIIALGLAVYGLYSWGYHNSELKWQAKWSQRDTDAATASAKREREFRQREQELQTQLDAQEVQNDQRVAEMQRIQSDAADTANGLRKQVERLRSQLQRGTGEASSDSWQLPAVTRAAMVLSDLYGSCVGHRQELARSFDESRQRGVEVEKMYDRARGQ